MTQKSITLDRCQLLGVLNLAAAAFWLIGNLENPNLIRPRIDISGPLTTDGNLLYRLNSSYTNGTKISRKQVEIRV